MLKSLLGQSLKYQLSILSTFKDILESPYELYEVFINLNELLAHGFHAKKPFSLINSL